MKNTIFESELKVLEILWSEGDTTAKDLENKLKESRDWTNTTTLQVIRRCNAKGLVERTKTNFMYRATITREEVEKQEPENLTDKVFDESSDLLLASLLGGGKLAPSQIQALRQIVQEFNVDE